jgi:hypothetical protein
MTTVLIADSTRSEVPNIMIKSVPVIPASAIAATLAAQEHAKTSLALDMFHCLFLVAMPSAAPIGAK